MPKFGVNEQGIPQVEVEAEEPQQEEMQETESSATMKCPMCGGNVKVILEAEEE